MKNRRNNVRSTLLNGAGTAALATLIATGAHAGETHITPDISASVTGMVDAHAVINASQENVGSADASIADAQTASLATGTDSAVSATVDANAMKASATGNDFTNTIDLSIVPTSETLGTGDGAAALAFSINTGAISSSVTADEIAALYADFPLGTVGVTGNSISAVTSGNSGSTLLQGAVLPDYASDTAGSSTLIANQASLDDWLHATGGLAASTVQVQSGAISNTATATDNDIRLNILNAEDDASVVASPTLEDNTIAATVSGNNSNSTIDVQSGGAPTLAGSAVVTNGQINSSPEGAASIVASNTDSAIIATIAADGDNTDDDAELRGSLSVAGNAITASASGNQALGTAPDKAGNRILLADGASFAGSGNVVDGPTARIGYNAGAMVDTVTADLIISNSQGNTGSGNLDRLAITGSEDDGEIAAVVDDISGGSVAVSGNKITGTANGNVASSAFASGDNMASFAGSAAVANQQVNFYTNVFAESTGNIDARVSDDDEVTESTVSVDGNIVAANAYGNSVSQDLALDAAVQDLSLDRVSLSGGTGGELSDGNVLGTGNLTVTNLQANYNADVDSREVHEIYATAGGDNVVDSSVGVKGNTAEAVSVGASAVNSLALSGTTVGNGAGIVSVQLNDDDDGDDLDSTDVSASSTGYTHLDTANNVDASSVELSGNLQRAIAYGGSATNTLGVTAETVIATADDTASRVGYDQGANDGMALTFTDQPQVNASNGVLNVQSLNGDIAAQALGADWSGVASSFAVNVDGDVTGGSVVNGGHVEDGAAVGGNALVAAAYGADATNTAGFHAGSLNTSDGDFAAALNLTNVQETTDASSVTAQAAGGAAVFTNVSDDLQDASVSTSFNTVQALAYANRAANNVEADGTNLDTELDNSPVRGEVLVGSGGSSTYASFSLNNAQVAGGDIAAALLDDLEEASTSAAVITAIGDDVNASSVASNGNTLSSGATGNRADNLLDLSGNSLATTSAIANLQVVSEETEIASALGIPGGVQNVETDPGTPDTPFTFSYTLSVSGLCSDGTCTDISGTDRVSTDELTFDQIQVLIADGWELDGENLERPTTQDIPDSLGDLAMASLNGSAFTGDGTVNGIDPTFEEMYVPGSGGVTVAIGGDLALSTVSVNGNTTAGSVTGNSASNALTVSGNALTVSGEVDDSDELLSHGVVNGSDAQASADHMLTNGQVVDSEDTELTSNVYGTFAIDMNDGADIAGSTLTVDGNNQSSRAVANTADNSVELDANNTATGTALVSNQFGGADVAATSYLEAYTPVASSGSQVSISGNTNLALGVMNNVTNTLTVDANSANPMTGATEAFANVDSDVEALGDHVLVNRQVAEDTVQASAATRLYNQEPTDLGTSGIVNGSITISGNSTMAEASANRAVNLADVTAGSSLGATAGVTNSQVSDAEVTSSAMTATGVILAGQFDGPAALNGGSITVGGNTTTALARGNAATNALNYAAGANYGTGMGNPASSSLVVNGTDAGVSGVATAQAAVLNAQVNTGAVSASASDATNGVVLNGDSGFPLVTNGTIAVTGNSLAAAAYGNTANNTLTLASLNAGQPTAAIGNYQANSASVTASVTSVTYGAATGRGSTTGSALSVTGNQVTASAIGNSAVNTIAGQ